MKNIELTPQVTTFFLLCLFMVIPFISFGTKLPFVSNQANTPEYNYSPSQETPCVLPTTRKLLQQQENQSPWPKHQFQASYPQTILTMDDVYLDEQQVKQNSSVLPVKTEYLYTPKAFSRSM